MRISLVVAHGEDFSIGKNGALPWHLPADMAYFRRLTTGHTVIMGRRTFDSIGKALPRRVNIVLSRSQRSDLPKEVAAAGSVEQCLSLCAHEELEHLFVIGGAEIYTQMLPHATRVYATLVHARFADADTFFTPLDPTQWRCTQSDFHPKDEKNAYDMEFQVWERI